MTQLEAIVERVESGQIGLEQALAEYERGVALVKRCREVLQRAELKVEELSALAAPSEQKPGDEDGR
jgi:exodeoxyribonuclease VII small subunit